PVYAIAKQLQWLLYEEYGEDKVMMGGLHIEMAVLSLIGDWLEGSGWVEILVKADVTTYGIAESFLIRSHVKRARYAHQVSVASLYVLQINAWKAYMNTSSDSAVQLSEWVEMRSKESAQFLYWYQAIVLQTLFLMLVHSVWEPNFDMYLDTLTQICPWVFALDHVHYARLLRVFVKTLRDLKIRLPKVHEEFMKGKFVIQKTGQPFSSLSDDHVHEQNNRNVKPDGGAVGLLGSLNALSKSIMGEMAAESVKTAAKVGQEQYTKYAHQKLVEGRASVHDVIQKNNLRLFRKRSTPTAGKEQLKVTALSQDCQLFSCLFIACHTREGDLGDFFSYENHSYLPSISEYGNLRKGNKTDTMVCLENCGTTEYAVPEATAVVIDGLVVVHVTKPGISKNFGQCSQAVFQPIIVAQLWTASRVDVIFDKYVPDSLKAETREKHGTGNRVKVASATPIPKDWNAFLQVDENKEELFKILSGHGKKTAWDIWRTFPEVTGAFICLSMCIKEISECHMAQIERYTVLLYDSRLMNAARCHFTKKNCQIENIPPTEAALREHTKRAALQAGHIWGQCLIRMPEIPKGWKKTDIGFMPLWIALPEALIHCYELIHCCC
uniref:Uncharacterized protein n=1 Tax=Latimeria chalumnae TaxID=7897 RepID=H3B0T6_LATCH